MMDKIDLFDGRRVGAEARRLALCFNLSARLAPEGGNPLAHAGRLFRESTGMAELPGFNRDELSFLRVSLMETAAIAAKGGATPQEIEDKAEMFFALAQEMGLVRARDRGDLPPRRPPAAPDEPHISFPGA